MTPLKPGDGIQIVGRSPSSLGQLVIGFLFAALLFWPAMLNRGIFLFPDTSTYVRSADGAVYRLTGYRTPWSDQLFVRYPNAAGSDRPDAEPSTPAADPFKTDRNVLSGRSIYYGLLLYFADRVGGFWTMAIGQAALIAAASVLMARRLAGAEASALWMSAIVAIPLITAIGFFATFMMPDFLASLSLGAAAMSTVFWTRMSRRERLFWLATLLLGLASHSANIVIIGIVAVGVAMIRLCANIRLVQWPVWLILVAAIIGEAAFSSAILRATGNAPVRPPFLAARLIDDGPGYSYLRETCPKRADFILCKYIDRLPLPSDSFLWSTGNTGVFSTMSPAEQRELASEEGRFLIAVILDRPVSVAKTSLASFFDQLSRTGMMEFNNRHVEPAKLPPDLRRSYLHTAAADGNMPIGLTGSLALPVLALSVFGIAAGLWHGRKDDGGFGDRASLIGILFAGIIVNAAVCGTISTPHDRYQTRMLWLIPLVALSMVANRKRTNDSTKIIHLK